MQQPITVLFICLGNICRSPMAEAVLRHKVRAAGLADRIHVASAGTGNWHIGEPAHPGTLEVLRRYGIAHDGCARQVTLRDLQAADYVIAMAQDNLRALQALDRGGVLDGKLALLLDFAPQVGVRDVPDPYYTGEFERVYELVDAGCQGLLEHICRQHGLRGAAAHTDSSRSA